MEPGTEPFTEQSPPTFREGPFLCLFVASLVLIIAWATPSSGETICSGETPYTFTFSNACPFPVWIGQHDSSDKNSYPPRDGNWALAGRCRENKDCTSGACDTAKGQCTCSAASDCGGGANCMDGLCSVTASFCMPKLWNSGVFWPRTGCIQSGDHLNCLTGQCNPEGGTEGLVDCAAQKTGPMSPVALFEATLNADNVNYDVSLASGYNIPVQVIPKGGCHKKAGLPAPHNKVVCFSSACQHDLNIACPQVLQKKDALGHVFGCDWPCHLCTSPNPPAGLKCGDYILKDAAGNDTDVTLDCGNAASAVTTGGDIALLDSQHPLKANAPAVFVLTAHAGYTLQSASGCNGSLEGATFTTTAITVNCTVSAAFAPSSGPGPSTTATFSLGLPTYVQMYCAKSYPDPRSGDDVPVMASTNQGTPVAFSQSDCFPDKQFVIPTWPSGYSPPAGQGVCLYTQSPQVDIPHFNDYNWNDYKLQKVQYCGGAPPEGGSEWGPPLPDGTPCGGYMSTAMYFSDANGYTCRTVSFPDADRKTRTAHLCLPPVTSGLGVCRESEKDGAGKLRAYRGVGGPFNAAWIAAGIQAGAGGKPYYEIFKKACPNAYTWQYDDASGGFQCFFESVESESVQDFQGFEVTFCGVPNAPVLADAIHVSLLINGIQGIDPFGLDRSNDGRINLPDLIFILQGVAGIR